MFNAAYTVDTEYKEVLKTLEGMLEEKGYRVEPPGSADPARDDLGTYHLRAVNKSILSVIGHQLKRTRDIDPEAQRAAIRFSVMPASDSSHIFLSIFPIMEFFHFPEIPGLSQSAEESRTDEMLCDSILDELTEAITILFPGAEEHFVTRPMRRTYILPDSRISFSRDEVQKTIIDILGHLKFEVVKVREAHLENSLEIIGINRSLFHVIRNMLRSRSLSRYLRETQRVTVRFTITKPAMGLDHRLLINVELFPSMEFLGFREIQSLTQSLDEEIVDSRLGSEIWEPLVKLLDNAYGPYM